MPGGAVILLLAAGASSRMRGADKLAELVDGTPLLRRQALAALATGAKVLVALPVPAGARGELVQELPVGRVPVADAALGMGHSIAAGARAVLASGADTMLVLNADLPEIDTPALRLVLAAAAAEPQSIHRGATESGDPGHPVAFPARMLPELAQLTGDRGAQEIVRREGARLVPLPGRAAVLDLDTPEDWAEWRRSRHNKSPLGRA